MSKKPKRQYQKKSFESTGASNDTSANIYMSMLMSKAWRKLTAEQQRLYQYCKAQLYAEKEKPSGNKIYFTMNQSKWCSMYGLYKESNAKGFYRDMSALIDFGFIVCVECGAYTRTKSIYSYSDMWSKYDTVEFKVHPNQRTVSMNRARKKSNSAIASSQ